MKPLTLPLRTLLIVFAFSFTTTAGDVVDTGQVTCFDAEDPIAAPAPDDAFFGQDAQYDGAPPGYTISGDGLTAYDSVTGLTWVRMPDTDGDGVLESPEDKLTWTEAQAHPATLNAVSFGGFDDWRLPTITELYSLILFSGRDVAPESPDGAIPFIDTDAFDFVYGDTSAGERIIDSQYASSTLYVASSAEGQLLFGVNFADGRIKGYGLMMPGGMGEKTFFVQCVRGAAYGVNDFVDNGDGTVTDTSTGLMWMQGDSGAGMNWEAALDFAEDLDFAGYTDWRLPNVKELQSLVDYTRSPETTASAAIDPVFDATVITNEAGDDDYAFYWSGTTHATETSGGNAAYVAFGRSLGYMQNSWVDVHGAGSQRSDPKDGDPDDYPYGHGPQGDAIRILNMVRCVRDVGQHSAVDTEPAENEMPQRAGLSMQATPNPFNPRVEISFSLPSAGAAKISVYDLQGRRVVDLLRAHLSAGTHAVSWNGCDADGNAMPSGVYLLRLDGGDGGDVKKVTLAR